MLSKGEVNRQEVLRLSTNGIEITEPKDIIKDPYVFEFLGIPEDKPVLESDLEKALVEHDRDGEITFKMVYLLEKFKPISLEL